MMCDGYWHTGSMSDSVVSVLVIKTQIFEFYSLGWILGLWETLVWSEANAQMNWIASFLGEG